MLRNRNFLRFILPCALAVSAVLPTCAAAAEATPPPAKPLLVAIGDSYTSGDGGDAMPNATGSTRVAGVMGPTCARSAQNYAQLVGAALGYTVRDVSCGGSTVGLAYLRGQLNAVTPDAKLVLLTLGGNDSLAVGGIMCMMDRACRPFAPVVNTTISALLYTVQPKLQLLLADIARRAPQAQIRIAGYPYVIAPAGQPLAQCAAFMTRADQGLVTHLQARLNGAIAGAARLSGPRVKYVDPTAPGSPFMATDNGVPRDGCSTNVNRWATGYVDRNSGVMMWHPNILGQRYYAETFLKTL